MSGLDCDIQDEVSRVESHSGDIELEEYGATPEPLPRRRQNPWTIRHTYYLRMGGFVFNPSLLFTGNDGNPSPDALRAELGARLSLTAQGVVFLSKHASDLIPDISEADIVDKSNADNFSRVLAIAQASWFLFQFIARLFVGLPVTILELNVVAHIIYAVLIFLFWWEKPLDIDLPTYVPAKSSKDFSLLAAMYTRSRIGYMQRVDGYHSLMNPHAAFLDLAPVVSEPGPRHGTDTPDTPALNDHDGTNEYPETAESRTSQLSLPFQISLGQARHGVKMVAWSHAHIFRYSKLRAAILRTPRTVLGHHVMFDCDSTGCECSKSPDFLNKARVTISSSHRRLFELARDCEYVDPPGEASRHGESAIKMYLQSACHRETLEKFHAPSRRLWRDFFAESVDYDNEELNLNLEIFVFGFFLNFSSIFGILHMLAWNGPFRTTTELILWRISASTLVFPIAMWLVSVPLSIIFLLMFLLADLALTFLFPRHIRRKFGTASRLTSSFYADQMQRLNTPFLHSTSRTQATPTKGFWKITLNAVAGTSQILVILYTLLFFLARFYFLVECVINVMYAPPRAFELPNWVSFLSYIPHIA